MVPAIRYPDGLPIATRRDEIAAAIRDHQVVVIAGETGSGKTTQLPKICLELGRGITGTIGHTQPRRIAARAVAEPFVERLVFVLGISFLKHDLREMRAADDVFACEGGDFFPGHRKAEGVEFVEDVAVAHFAAIADPFHLADQFGVVGIHPVAQHVHDAVGAVDAEFDAGDEADGMAKAGGEEAGEAGNGVVVGQGEGGDCLLYTSDAADDLLCVDLGGRRIIKKKIQSKHQDDHQTRPKN